MYPRIFFRRSWMLSEGEATSIQIVGACSRGVCSRRLCQNASVHHATSGATTAPSTRTPTSTKVFPPSLARKSRTKLPAIPPCSVFTGLTEILPHESSSTSPRNAANRGSAKMARQRAASSAGVSGSSMTSSACIRDSLAGGSDLDEVPCQTVTQDRITAHVLPAACTETSSAPGRRHAAQPPQPHCAWLRPMPG